MYMFVEVANLFLRKLTISPIILFDIQLITNTAAVLTMREIPSSYVRGNCAMQLARLNGAVLGHYDLLLCSTLYSYLSSSLTLCSNCTLSLSLSCLLCCIVYLLTVSQDSICSYVPVQKLTFSVYLDVFCMYFATDVAVNKTAYMHALCLIAR